MYSLPINTYSDYWRTTKLWSKYLGGTATLAVGVTVLTMPDLEFPHVFNIPAQVFGQTGGDQAAALGEISGQRDLISDLMEVEIQITDHIEPFETEYIESNQIPAGMSQIQQEGKNGAQRKVVRTVSIGGEEGFQVIRQFELESPKKRVVIQNTTPVLSRGMDVSSLAVKENFKVEATAYTHTGDRTASGLEARVGLIAVDPNVIPLGTMLYVDGYGYAVAADTGGAIKGKMVDVFFDTWNECMEWGRRSVDVYILSSNKG